jgi:hypothetical protein
MAFPAEGVEGTYRNNIDHVAALLKQKHATKFRLYNLSNRIYDFSKFDSSVVNWCGFPDHHPPPLLLLFLIVHDIHDWLSTNPENIAVIHCLVNSRLFKLQKMACKCIHLISCRQEKVEQGQ